MKRMHSPFAPLRPLLAALAATLLFSAPAFAHPHAFVEAEVTFVFDETGLSGIHERWRMDEMLAASVLDLINKTGADPLTKAEADAIERQSFRLLKQYNYFTHIRIDGKPFPVQWARDFTVSLDGHKMIYDFVVPCHVKAGPRQHRVITAVFDDTFYTYVTYAEEGGSGIDPSADPQYRNTDAPASPQDFQRFSQSVKLRAYDGGVHVAGPTNGFELHTEVRDMPSMSYYYDQIVPEALVIDFRKP